MCLVLSDSTSGTSNVRNCAKPTRLAHAAQTPTTRVVTPHTVFKPTARYNVQAHRAKHFNH